jgi:hypothetical protein
MPSLARTRACGGGLVMTAGTVFPSTADGEEGSAKNLPRGACAHPEIQRP